MASPHKKPVGNKGAGKVKSRIRKPAVEAPAPVLPEVNGQAGVTGHDAAAAHDGELSPLNRVHADVMAEGSPASAELDDDDTFELATSQSFARPSIAGRSALPSPCITADKVKREEVEWLWKPYIANANLTLLSGPPDAGKSCLLAAIAAQITGGPALQGTARDSGRVLYYNSPEQPLGSTVVPRLEAAGAVMSRVHFGNIGPDGKKLPRLSLPQDMAILHDMAWKVGASAILFDPLASFLGDGVDRNDPKAIRFLLESLTEFAQENQYAVAFIAHPRKSHEGSAMGWVAGTTVWVEVPAVVIALGQDPDRPDVRVLTCSRNRLSKDKPSRLYTLGTGQATPTFKLGGSSSMTADDLGSASEQPGHRDALSRAVAFLKDALYSGEATAQAIKDKGAAAMLSTDTLGKAKVKLGVTHHPIGGNDTRIWVWRKPEEWPE